MNAEAARKQQIKYENRQLRILPRRSVPLTDFTT
jgi:hypothetical protein